MVDTYDPSLPTARDRLRHSLSDMGTPKDPPSIPPIAFEIQDALDPNVTYDANLDRYGEDEAKWRMAIDFLARYGNEIDAVTLDDHTRIVWSHRIDAWRAIVQAWEALAVSVRRGQQKPLVGQLKTQGVIGPPDGRIDANDPWFRGSPYPRNPW